MHAHARTLAAVAAAATLALPASASAGGILPPPPDVKDVLRPLGDRGPLADELLSDEQTLSRWARAYRRASVLKSPVLGAPAVARLRFMTEDGMPEVYLVLRSRVDARGQAWLQLRVPMRPNGTTGWVPREAMSPLKAVTTHLLIDRTTLWATLRDRGRIVWRARVGVGKAATPTPAGRFWIRERLRALGGIYGPWAIGTSAYSTLSEWPGGGVVGIHGTNQPRLIPGRPSHGCIRLRNDKISELVRLAPIGTPIEIR